MCLNEIVSLLSLLSKEFLILSNGHLTQLIFLKNFYLSESQYVFVSNTAF